MVFNMSSSGWGSQVGHQNVVSSQTKNCADVPFVDLVNVEHFYKDLYAQVCVDEYIYQRLMNISDPVRILDFDEMSL